MALKSVDLKIFFTMWMCWSTLPAGLPCFLCVCSPSCSIYILSFFQNTFYLLFSCQNIFYLFCSPGCSKYTFTNRIHFGLTIIKNTQHKIRNVFYLGTFMFHNSFWSYHHYVHAVAEEGTGVATWPVETFIFLTIVFHTLYNQARDSDLKAWQRWQSFQNFRSSFCFSPAELVDLRIPIEHVTVIADPSTRCCYVHRICWIPNKFIWGEYSTGHQTIT